MYLSKPKAIPPKIKHLLNVYFTVNFIHLIHKTCQILSTFTNLCQCLHLHSQCLHFPHTLPIIPRSSLLFHNISSVPSIALYLQHFMKTYTVTSGEMPCHAIMIPIEN
jgi:hypothetical protein